MRVFFRLRHNSRVIYCRIIIDGVLSNDFSTFISVESPGDWDQAKQRIKGRSLKVTNNNKALGIIEHDITQLYFAHPDLSAHRLSALYRKKERINYSFVELIDMFEARCKEKYDNPETLGTYTRRIANIRRFLEEKNLNKLMGNQMTLGIADDFVTWMISQKYDQEYIVRHVQVLKAVTNMATRKDILKLDPLATFELKHQEETNTDHLTKQQLVILETMDWNPELQAVVDIFLFSVYTGLHYGDAQSVKPNEIGTGIDGRLWLFKPRGKYKDSQFFNAKHMVQMVPLHTKAQLLIEKYGGVDKLPKIDNVTYNATLKQIKYMAGIELNLTVMTARKTFTDIMLNELKISEDTVAKMLGHKTTRYVKHYAKVDQRRVSGEMDDNKVNW